MYQLRQLVDAEAKSTWDFGSHYLRTWRKENPLGFSTFSPINRIRCHLEACFTLTALQFGLFEFWPTYTLGNNLRETILHLGTRSLLLPWLGTEMRSHSSKSPFDRLLRTLATCLADGISSNSLTPIDESDGLANVSIWQTLVWDSFMKAGGGPGSAAPVWLLFLSYGANRDFTLSFEQSCNFSETDHRGKLVRVTGYWGPDKTRVHSPISLHDEDRSGILELAKRQNWSISLKELTYFWFPPFADRFRRIYELYESNVDTPIQGLSDLRRELGLDPECWQTQIWDGPRPQPQYVLEGTSGIVQESGEEWDVAHEWI